MNRVHRFPLLALIAILAAAALVSGTLALRHSTPALVQAAAPSAIALAVSPATHHVFALSGYGEGGAGWVTILNATSHRVLKTVSVPAGGQQIVVDDATKHVLVISGAVLPTAAAMTRVTMLDAKTGRRISTRSLKKGVVRWAEDKSLLKQLFVIVGPSASSRWFGAGATLYGINTRSLEVAHRLTLQPGDQVAEVNAMTGRLLIGNADGSVRIYDVLKTWKVAARAFRSLPNPSVMGTDDRQANVGVIDGPQRDTLTIISSLTGGFVYETTYPPLTQITSYALDELVPGRVLTGAGPLKDGVPTGNGLVSVQNPHGGEELAQTAVGVDPVQALIDPKTRHAFVLSYDRIDTPGGWKSRLLVSTFDLSTGKLLEQTPVVAASGSTIPDLVLDSASGYLYLTGLGLEPATQASASQLIVLSPKTGTIMHTIRLPGAPTR